MPPQPSDFKHTDFGYRSVPMEAKSTLVAHVFHSVAPNYDLMNDVMSFGLHRLWKRFTIRHADIKKGQTVLDVASGTGDLARVFAKQVGPTGHVMMTDINEAMLNIGRDRLTNSGLAGNVSYLQADAECLPFEDNYFDCITIAFGLRNVTQKENALRSLYRVLKPGGKLIVLEFSHSPVPLIRKLYDLYSFNMIPKMGAVFAKDKDSYQYLVESIRMHPDQETLKSMMQDAEFEDVTYFNLTGGIVALHKGYKY